MIQTTIRIPEELYKGLKDFAKIRGLTLNAVINNALWDSLKKQTTGSDPKETTQRGEINGRKLNNIERKSGN